MAYFDHPSPKRTLCWSSRPEIQHLWVGKLTKKVRSAQKAKYPEFKSTVKYKDKDGRTRFKGSKSLKSTQKLGSRN